MRPRSLTLLPLIVLGASLTGCTAIKSTVHLAQGEQALYDARAAGGPEYAVYAWTMAEEAQKKAREEWGYSDFGAAESLSRTAAEWSAKARDQAAQADKVKKVEGAGDAAIPEQVTPPPVTPGASTSTPWGAPGEEAR